MIHESDVLTWEGGIDALVYHLIPPACALDASSLWHQRSISPFTRALDLDVHLENPRNWVVGAPDAKPPAAHVWWAMARIALCGAAEHGRTNLSETAYADKLWEIAERAIEAHRNDRYNVLWFGLVGIIVRLSDHVSELRALLDRADIDDHLGDLWSAIVVDCFQALMLDKGWYALPLENDCQADHPGWDLHQDVDPNTGRVVQWYEVPLPLNVV